MTRLWKRAACCVSAALLVSAAVAAEPMKTEIVDVRKIWDEAPHNAFTDLVWHDGRWYCVFREGTTHVSEDGALRVLTSEDGQSWTSAARITSPDADLRDAKIVVAPSGKLMLCGAGALRPPAKGHQSYVWYSENGREWGEAIPVGEPNFWLWRATWHDDAAYGVGYGTGQRRSTRLYKSEDGRKFDVLVPEMLSENYPNESSLLFRKDGTGLCLTRRDGEGDSTAMLGTAKPPYTDWSWKSLGVRVGGPQLIELPDGRIVVGGRRYPGGAKTQLWWLDPQEGSLEEIATLPSGGDTSYPGLAFHDDLLWVSYYSSHEAKTSIYLARVRLPQATPAGR